MNDLPSISVVIPTYNREEVLVQTIDDLLKLQHQALEILVIDQSQHHTEMVDKTLKTLQRSGSIKWIKLNQPSIPNAMNVGALSANGEVVLFLDDDIRLRSELIVEHARRYLKNDNINAVAGQVIQSWEQELTIKESAINDINSHDPDAFQFNSSIATATYRFMGGNVSFIRKDLLSIGGFDTNFTKVAYRFEAETAERFLCAGHNIAFEPKASLQHLKVETGGTRTYGDHLTSLNPSHTIGMYYYLLIVKNQHNRWWRFLSAPFKSVMTRFHLKHPWYIPVTFISNVSGLFLALSLRIKGQKLLTTQDIEKYKYDTKNIS